MWSFPLDLLLCRLLGESTEGFSPVSELKQYKPPQQVTRSVEGLGNPWPRPRHGARDMRPRDDETSGMSEAELHTECPASLSPMTTLFG